MAIGLSLGFGSCFMVIVLICMVFFNFCNIQDIKARQAKSKKIDGEADGQNTVLIIIRYITTIELYQLSFVFCLNVNTIVI